MSTDILSTVEYPESDGQPMAESDLHRDCMARIIELLKYHVRGQRTYVTGALHLYYCEGDPSQMVCPDAMVVKDSDPGPRRTYRLWVEQRTPCFVLETTSDSTRELDQGLKRDICALLRVPEYFLFDPTGDYVPHSLAGYRLTSRGYEPMAPDADGRLHSKELGLKLGVKGEKLQLFSTAPKQLLTASERLDAETRRARAGDRPTPSRTRASTSGCTLTARSARGLRPHSTLQY